MSLIESPLEFRAFDKITRLSRPCVITEKIDGTNASVFIGENGEFLTGSRTRWITPEDDNYGFSRWAHEHKDELLLLGSGRHFGEWWGQGIQRNYGLTEKRFSLFNTGMWCNSHEDFFDVLLEPQSLLIPAPRCCYVVPILWRGLFDTRQVEHCLANLRSYGSRAAPGFMKPEGMVIYHTALGKYFKKTCEHDDEPKNAHHQRVAGLLPHSPKAHPYNPNTTGRRKGLTPTYAGAERRAR